MAIESAYTLLGAGIYYLNIFFYSLTNYKIIESASVHDFVVCEPLTLELNSTRALQLVATPSKNEHQEFSFEIFSRAIEEAGV